MECRDACLVSRHGFSCLALGSVSTLLVLALSQVPMTPRVSFLMTVLTVSLSRIANCLFCAETLAFLAESTQGH